MMGMGMGGRGGFNNGGMGMGGGRGGMMGFGRGGMNMMGGNGMMGGNSRMMMQQQELVPNPYVSVAMLSESVSLLQLFNLLECWGTVLWAKRNFNKRQIVVVKMSSPQEAVMVSSSLKNLPFYDAFISARTFNSFNERGGEPAEEGDCSNSELLQFSFLTHAHRQPGWRSKGAPTFCVAIGNLSSAIDESAIANYLREVDVSYQSIAKATEGENAGSFVVVCNDIFNAAKLVSKGQGAVCKEDKAQTKFITPPEGATSVQGGNNGQTAEQQAAAEKEVEEATTGDQAAAPQPVPEQ